ncbi:MAG: ankyrin repeat domain-containing protein [Acidiferrobacterales bacterium]
MSTFWRRWLAAILFLQSISSYACSLGPPVVERQADVYLFSAVANDRPQAVLGALKHGANVNFRARPWGLTPLLMAARLPADMSRLLLAHGASVDLADVHGRTALMKAVYRGNVPVVRLLLGHGALVNRAGPQDKTALFYAIVSGRPPLVQLLLEHGAQVNLADNYGQTPLSLAEHMLHAAQQISPAEQRVMMSMRPADSMFMRTKAQEIRNSTGVLALLRKAGAKLDQQPARSLAVADVCDLDERVAARPSTVAAPKP